MDSMKIERLKSWLQKGTIFTLLVFLFVSPSHADKKTSAKEAPILTAQEKLNAQLTIETLSTLITYVEIQTQLRKEIKSLKKTLKSAQTELEKTDAKALLEKAELKLQGTSKNLEDIAADTDLGLLRIVKDPPFNLQRELFSLLEPALKEMKHATSDVRLKSQLREKILYYEQRVPILKEALRNIAVLNRANKNKKIKNELIKMNKA